MAAIRQATAYLEQSTLSASDCAAFSTLIRIPLSEADVRQFHSVAQKTLREFREVSLSSQGFFPFQATDIAQFICTDTQFGFEFNKKRNQGTLYGNRHTQIRRCLINDSPSSLVIPLITRKLTQLHIPSSDNIDLVEDLGMGQAVYHIRSSKMDVVIKRTEAEALQPFYASLLSRLNWPSYHCRTQVSDGSSWELTDYLGADNLMSTINTQSKLPTDIVLQLARHAALADILGRGDRHFENYVVQNQTLFPVDISHLFWENNEEWISKYCHAGLYEICADLSQVNLFLAHYAQTMTDLRNTHADLIMDQINVAFPQDARSKIDYVTARLTPQYLHAQSQRYRNALIEFEHRQPYRNWLNQMALEDPKALRENELLYMYYLANQNRNAAFFLIEERSEPLFEWIRSWARKRGFDSAAASQIQ